MNPWAQVHELKAQQCSVAGHCAQSKLQNLKLLLAVSELCQSFEKASEHVGTLFAFCFDDARDFSKLSMLRSSAEVVRSVSEVGQHIPKSVLVGLVFSCE